LECPVHGFCNVCNSGENKWCSVLDYSTVASVNTNKAGDEGLKSGPLLSVVN